MNYTSPVKTIRASKYNNHISDTSRQYQQQYWKSKANSMTDTIDNLTNQNQILNKRIIDMSRIEQQLRQIIKDYENDWKKRSRRLTVQRNDDKFEQVYQDKLTNTNELERLYKQIRIIKNTHQIQINKLLEQNKKMKKIVSDHQQIQSKISQNVTTQKIINKQNQQIKSLKKKLQTQRQTSSRLRQQKSKLVSDNQKLRKQIQDIKMKQKLVQKQQEEKLLDYTRKFDSMSQPRVNKNISKISSIAEQKQSQSVSQKPQNQQSPSMSDVMQFAPVSSLSAENQQMSKRLKQTQQQLSKTKKQLVRSQAKQIQITKKLELQEGNLVTEKLSYQVKLKKVEGELIQAKTQLSDVLRKLSPLLSRRVELSPGPESSEKRASLSILQIFMKKYKIQAF